MHEPGGRRRARRLRGHAARATRGRAGCCARPWSRSRTRSPDGPAARVVREGLLPGPRRGRDAPPPRRSRARTGSSSREYHPDANPGDAAAEERFKEVSAAYDVVGDAEQAQGVRRGRAGSGPAAAGFPGGGGPGGAAGSGFQDARRPRRPARRPVRPRRPAAAARGAARPAPRARTSRPSSTSPSTTPSPASPPRCTSPATRTCHTCHGSGAKPGTTPHRCAQLRRPGRASSDNQGLFSFSSPCPRVRRPRRHDRRPVPHLPRPGRRAPPREVKVRIPAGVDDGQRIRLKGRGGPGRNGGPPGDLYVVVRVAPPPAVRRARAATSPSPCRSPSPRPPSAPTSRCPPSTAARSRSASRPAPARAARSGSRARAWPTPKGTGDLLVTVEVAVPAKLSAAPSARRSRRFQAASDGASPREHLGV